MLNVATILVGAFDVNCYVVWTTNLNALVVDPGADAGAILKFITSHRLKITAYLITHGHIDHISALEPLWNKLKAPVAMHISDAKWAFSTANQMLPFYPAPRRPTVIERILKGGEIFEGRVGQPCPTEPNGGTGLPAKGGTAGDQGCPALPGIKFPCLNKEGFSYQVIHTPGHSPGGVCFYFPEENILFAGDTLFQGSVGRTDLPGGNEKQLNKSLQILAALPPQTKVYPGHGPQTTIEREIESNPFLKPR